MFSFDTLKYWLGYIVFVSVGLAVIFAIDVLVGLVRLVH